MSWTTITSLPQPRASRATFRREILLPGTPFAFQLGSMIAMQTAYDGAALEDLEWARHHTSRLSRVFYRGTHLLQT